MVFDRYPLFLDVVSKVLSDRSVEVRGQTSVPEHALELLDEHSPDVFVAGIDTGPGVDGIDLIRRATTTSPDLKVIALSNGTGGERVEEAFAAGACAYVTKRASWDDIAVAIRQMFDHSIHLASDRPRREPAVRAAADDVGLTDREQQILSLVAEGHSNAELASQLWVTEQTVKFHLSNIYRKINVSNRTQASRWALLAEVGSGGER